jgi:hypothetical protein
MNNHTGWYIVFSWRGKEILCRQYRSVRNRERVEEKVAAVLEPGTFWVQSETLAEAHEKMRKILSNVSHGGSVNVSANQASERVH